MEFTSLQLDYSRSSTQFLQTSALPDSYGPSSGAVTADYPGGGGAQRFQNVGYYQFSEQLDLKLKNKDGDTFQVSYDIQGEVAMAEVGNGDNLQVSHGNFENFFNKIKEFIEEQEQRILDFLINHSGFLGDSSVQNAMGLGETSTEAIVPEYWNAENTSNRIVDFATSFFSNSDGDVNEFGKKIVAAVKKGFEEANEMLGNLPGPVAELISDTQSLTLEKLDAWIAQHNQADFLA